MNINGVARGYMARNLCAEEFLKKVGEMVECQLKEWDLHYELNIMKLKRASYELEIRNQDDYYRVPLSTFDIRYHQNSGAYQLDKRIWKELADQGLTIITGKGNYIDYIFKPGL